MLTKLHRAPAEHQAFQHVPFSESLVVTLLSKQHRALLERCHLVDQGAQGSSGAPGFSAGALVLELGNLVEQAVYSTRLVSRCSFELGKLVEQAVAQ